MRPVLHTDLLMAARAVRCVPTASRAERLAQWLREAHWADRYRKRLGRAHPHWGNGSLLARAMAEPLAQPSWPDNGELVALAEVIAAVLGWRGRMARRG